MPSLTPPSRVKKAWRIAASPAARALSVIIAAPSAWSLEAGGRRQARRDQRQRLEQGAHLARIDQARETALASASRCAGRRRAAQRRQPRLGAERGEKSALRHRAVHRGAGGRAASAKRSEIDMGAEIGAARLGEHAGGPMPAHRRERRARAALGK